MVDLFGCIAGRKFSHIADRIVILGISDTEFPAMGPLSRNSAFLLSLELCRAPFGERAQPFFPVIRPGQKIGKIRFLLETLCQGHVQAFNTDTLATCRDLLPMVTRFLLRMVPRPEDIATARNLGAVAINPSYRGFSLRKSVVAEIRDNGLGVFVWTVDEMNEWRELLDAQVDGIITNHPGRLQGFLAGRFDPVK